MKTKRFLSLLLCAALCLLLCAGAYAQDAEDLSVDFVEDSGDYTRVLELLPEDEDGSYAVRLNYGWLSVRTDGSFTYTLDTDCEEMTVSRDRGIVKSELITGLYRCASGLLASSSMEIVIRPAGVKLAGSGYRLVNDGSDASIEGNLNDPYAHLPEKWRPTLEAVCCPWGRFLPSDDGTLTYTLHNHLRAVQMLPKNDLGEFTLQVRLTDAAGALTLRDIPVSIRGVNDKPTVKSYAHAIMPGDTSSISGNVLVDSSYGDGAPARHVFAWGEQAALYGTMTRTVAGNYTYQLDNTLVAVAGLAVGSTLTERFPYTYKDVDGDVASGNVVIIIGEEERTPTVQSYTATLTEDADPDSAAAVYTYTIADVLAGSTLGNGTAAQHHFAWTSTEATDYGTVSLGADGRFSFTLNNDLDIVQALYPENGDVTQTYNYTYTDLNGDVANGAVTITIRGENDAPQAGSATCSVTENDAVAESVATGNVFNVCTCGDGTQAQHHVEWDAAVGSAYPDEYQLACDYGSVVLRRNGEYEFHLDNAKPAVRALAQGESISLTYDFAFVDVNGAYNDGSLTVEITGTNSTPSGRDITVGYGVDDAGQTRTGNVLNATGIQVGDGTTTVVWIEGAGTHVLQGVVSSWITSITIGADGSYSVTMADELVGIGQHVITFKLTDSNGDESGVINLIFTVTGGPYPTSPAL